MVETPVIGIGSIMQQVYMLTGLSLAEEIGNQWNGTLNDVTLKVFILKSRITLSSVFQFRCCCVNEQ